MLVIDAAVSHLENLACLEEYLCNLGKKHQAVGVKVESFSVRCSLLSHCGCLFTPGCNPQLSPSFLWVQLSGEKADGSGQPVQGADTNVVTLPQ